MDLDMPEISGMEAAARIRKEDEDTILIFVTNREDLVFRSFQYEVAAFIRKSHLESEFSAVMIEAYQKAKSKSSRYLLKTENGEAVFSANDILYFVSSDHKVWIHNKDGTKIRVLYTLEKLGSILSRDIFIRCHSGFIVNCNYIFSIDMEQIKLTTNESIPLSRYRRKEVKSMFHTYLRSL
jgi:DNA-binding LytR/AlgR family response regulator